MQYTYLSLDFVLAKDFVKNLKEYVEYILCALCKRFWY